MEEEDTIELIDYLRVVWKYRYLIVIGVVLCATVVAAWSFSLPKVYRVSTILEVNPRAMLDLPSIIGHLFLAESHKKKQLYLKPWIDSPSIITASVNAGMFNSQLRDKLKQNLKTFTIPNLSFKASNPKNTNMIRITYETADIKMGEGILELLNRFIIERYQKEVDEVKDLILLEEEIKKNHKAHIDVISNQTKFIDNTLTQRGKDKKEVRIEDSSGLILLRTSLHDSLLRGRNLLLKTEKVFAKLRLSYEEGGPVRIIQKPTSSSTPIQPKIKLNILLACVVGLFLSVFLAFFIEYIRKVPKATRKED